MQDVSRPARPRYAVDFDQYIILSTTLSVFLWQVLYAGVINFYLGYVVVLLNSALLFARGNLVVHRRHAYFLVGVALVSMCAAILTHNPVRAMAAQIVGVAIFSIYHYTALYDTKFSLRQIMKIYSGWAAVAALWGYPVWLIHKIQNDTLYRFHSWFSEPSHYVYATLPAASYALLRWQREKEFDPLSLPLLLSYIPAGSSTAYLGIGITLLLMTDFRSLKRILVAGVLLVAAAYATYTFSANVQERVNDTVTSEIKAETTDALSDTVRAGNPDFGANATTFAMVTNGYVAWRAFLDSPWIGNGLGTHATSYDKYSVDIVSPKFFLWGLNKDDANSLLFRLMSETGALGVITVLFLIFYFGRTRGKEASLIRDAIIPYFIMRLVRFGAYFSMENFFFIMMYGMNFLQSRRSRNLLRGADE